MRRRFGGHEGAGRVARLTIAIAVVAGCGIFTVASPAATAASSPKHAASASAAFVPGEATAISQALAIAPRTGGLAAAVNIGISIAQFRSSLAQASSQAVDLGVVGTTLTVQCDANPPTLQPDQLPQPLVAESADGNDHAEKTTAGTGNNGVLAVAGKQSVNVTTAPAAIAGYVGNALGLSGLLQVSGLTSSSTARLIPGQARIATATAQIGQLSLLNGMVKLSGLTWTVTRRTGTHPSSHGSFQVSDAVVAGKHLPALGDNLGSLLNAIDKALAPVGLHVDLPTFTVRKDGTRIMSPLTIGIDNSKVGGSVINPVLNALQPITNPLRQALTNITCKTGAVLSALDLLTSALDGTGGLDINLGGVSAESDGKAYSDPFGQPPATSPPATATGPGNTSKPQGGAGNGASPVKLPSGSTAPPTSSAPPPKIAGNTVASSQCSTTSSAGRPTCSDGAALVVGLIALGTVGAIGTADFLAMRRRRRLPQVEL